MTMKLAQGVDLHFIKTQQFKMTHLTMRFSGEMDDKTMARRVLVAQMLATASEAYPTSQQFRKKLASLYGASLTTSVSTRGMVHIVDIDIIFVDNPFGVSEGSILEDILHFLFDILARPLKTAEQYQSKTFNVEKKNLLHYLEVDKEDYFYYSDLEMRKLFYDNPALQNSKYSSPEQVALENSFTAFQEFQKMIWEDKIDIFIVGNFDEYRALQIMHQVSFSDRNPDLQYVYNQKYSNITREKTEKKNITQSILQLAYSVPVSYHDKNYFSLILLNGMLGAFSHSRLFTTVREDEGLAYSIGSHLDTFTGLLKVYAGIDSDKRVKTMQLINRELNQLRLGRFPVQLLRETKKMILTNIMLSMDNPKYLIETKYNSLVMPQDFLELDHWVAELNQVTKEDIMKVASLIKLQVVYFLEGEA